MSKVQYFGNGRGDVARIRMITESEMAILRLAARHRVFLTVVVGLLVSAVAMFWWVNQQTTNVSLVANDVSVRQLSRLQSLLKGKDGAVLLETLRPMVRTIEDSSANVRRIANQHGRIVQWWMLRSLEERLRDELAEFGADSETLIKEYWATPLRLMSRRQLAAMGKVLELEMYSEAREFTTSNGNWWERLEEVEPIEVSPEGAKP